MPPSSPPTLPQRPLDTDHLLARSKPFGEGGLRQSDAPRGALPQREKSSGIGPVVGIVIILLLLVFGGFYFWGASMNKQAEPLPFIPGDSTQQAE